MNVSLLVVGLMIVSTTTTAFMLLLVVVPTTMQVSYAQFGEQQQQEVESDDGGLTATLNGETFRRGDPVTIRGTVGEASGSSSFYVEIRDPDGIRIGTWSISVNNDLTFIHGFTAGLLRGMDKFGTYLITLKYFPPGTGSGIETTDLSFEYVSGTTGTTTATENKTVTMDAAELRDIIMAIRESRVNATEYTEQANIAMQNNDAQAVFGNLTLIENELENIRWNLTDITRALPATYGVG